MYDVYLTTGGVKLIGGGSDVWIRYWIKYIVPHLEVRPVLMIDRPDPNPNETHSFDIEVVYRDDDDIWWDCLERARHVHILHMYYHERDTIKKNIDKIDSIALHVCTEQSLNAAQELGLGKTNVFHHAASIEWENSIIPHIPNPIWIGVNFDVPFHRDYDHIINIPNLYVFEKTNDLVYSNTVGYAARIESRKCPHYLDGIKAEFFTSYMGLKKWSNHYGDDFSKSKIYDFNWNFIDNFYSKKTWGIFHACYRAEPFGYSVFQSVDYGKLPIIETGWDPNFDYPFRASNKQEFVRQYNRIKRLDYLERDGILKSSREYLKNTYGIIENWVNSYLEIYNK